MLKTNNFRGVLFGNPCGYWLMSTYGKVRIMSLWEMGRQDTFRLQMKEFCKV